MFAPKKFFYLRFLVSSFSSSLAASDVYKRLVGVVVGVGGVGAAVVAVVGGVVGGY